MLTILMGFLLWTFVEYLFHRFVLHGDFENETIKELQEYFHGLHHALPNVTLYLPLSYHVAIFLTIFILLPLKIGIGCYMGFITYEILHYALHHKNYSNKIFKYLKKHHFYHHFKDNSKNFAVTLPIWDYIFSTIHRLYR